MGVLTSSRLMVSSFPTTSCSLVGRYFSILSVRKNTGIYDFLGTAAVDRVPWKLVC